MHFTPCISIKFYRSAFCRRFEPPREKVVATRNSLFFVILLGLLVLAAPVVQGQFPPCDTIDFTNSSDPGLKPGMAVVTASDCNLSENDPTTDRFSVRVVDIRDPQNLAPGLDQNWQAPIYSHDDWKSENLGDVFGIALDDHEPPNIYVTATTVLGYEGYTPRYGALAQNVSTGFWGVVYKLDGVTGIATVFASLPNSGQQVSGPGLGNICFDPDHGETTLAGGAVVPGQFFVSNFEDGLIYRLDRNGSVTGTYDHGIDGRQNYGVAQIPDDVSWGATPPGRRVWGLQIHPFEDRLYYGVWWETFLGDDNVCNVTSESNEIWSVALDPITGAPDATTTTREFLLPDFLSSDRSNPPADIAFSPSGKMLVAERSMVTDSPTCSYTPEFEPCIVRQVWQFDGNPATPAPFLQSYEHTITISDNQLVGDVNVRVSVEHIWAPQHLRIELTHCNQTVILSDYNNMLQSDCPRGDPNIHTRTFENTLFDQDSPNAAYTLPCPFDNPDGYRPSGYMPAGGFGDLDVFDNCTRAGDWTLKVTDLGYQINTTDGWMYTGGALKSWCLYFPDAIDDCNCGVGERCFYSDDHDARVLEYTGDTIADGGSGWAPSDTEKFPVGQCYDITVPLGSNATGGVDYIDGCEKVVAMGDCLHNENTPNAPPSLYNLYGIQQFPSGGWLENPVSGPPWGPNYTANSYLVDVDCNTASSVDNKWKFLGDIEVYRKLGCLVTASAECTTVYSPNTGDPNDAYFITFQIENQSGCLVTHMVTTTGFLQPITPVSCGESTGSYGYHAYGCGGDFHTGEIQLGTLNVSGQFVPCCTAEINVLLPACCVGLDNETTVVDPLGSGGIRYDFDLTNIVGFEPEEAAHAFLVPLTPGITLSQSWFDLLDPPGSTSGVPLGDWVSPDGDSRHLRTIIYGAADGEEVCFQISIHDATMAECCGIVCCVTVELDSCYEDFACVWNGGGSLLHLSWTPSDKCCGETLMILNNGAFVAAVDALAGEIAVGCAPGEWCIACPQDGGPPLVQSCCYIDCGALTDPSPFLRGDANSDGTFDIADVISTLEYLFEEETVPCLVALDSNDDEAVDVADPIFSLEVLFGSWPGPPPPTGLCGDDETVGPLGCDSFPACDGTSNDAQGG